jgi:hypothetical protein
VIVGAQGWGWIATILFACGLVILLTAVFGALRDWARLRWYGRRRRR